MKKLIALITIATALIAGVNLYAADAPAQPTTPAPKPADKKTPMCCMFMEQFTLFTPAQKEKAVALHKQCDKAGCTEAAQKTFFASVKALLTPDQIKACRANCEKAGIKNCPICSDSSVTAKKKTS